MTNTQSPAPGVAAILSKLQEQEPIGYSGVERTDVDVGVTRDAVLRWVHADEEDEPLYSMAQIRTALQASAAAVPVMTIGFDESEKCRSLPFGMKLYAHPPLPAQVQEAEAPTAKEILQAVSRGWCHEKNASKVMDPDLAIAISAEINDLLASRTPAPGMAGGVGNNRVTVDKGALKLALNVLRRAGKTEVADAFEETAAPHPSPAPQAAEAITWPKEKRVGRREDMSPDGTLIVGLDSDNDVYIEVSAERFGEWQSAAVEFCNGGGGGGQSSATRAALINLMTAIEADNETAPHKAFPGAGRAGS